MATGKKHRDHRGKHEQRNEPCLGHRRTLRPSTFDRVPSLRDSPRHNPRLCGNSVDNADAPVRCVTGPLWKQTREQWRPYSSKALRRGTRPKPPVATPSPGNHRSRTPRLHREPILTARTDHPFVSLHRRPFRRKWRQQGRHRAGNSAPPLLRPTAAAGSGLLRGSRVCCGAARADRGRTAVRSRTGRITGEAPASIARRWRAEEQSLAPTLLAACGTERAFG